MRVVLADLKGVDGFVHKDTVVGGYGARLRPLSRVTALAAALRQRLSDVPSITMGYLAAIFDEAGHDVAFTRGAVPGGALAAVMALAACIGPATLAELGWRAGWTPLVPAALVVLLAWWRARRAGAETESA